VLVRFYQIASRIAMMESNSSCERMKSWRRFWNSKLRFALFLYPPSLRLKVVRRTISASSSLAMCRSITPGSGLLLSIRISRFRRLADSQMRQTVTAKTIPSKSRLLKPNSPGFGGRGTRGIGIAGDAGKGVGRSIM
jgi:hypothetical protein